MEVNQVSSVNVDREEMNESVGENIISIATEYTLYQNYPNPFNPTTKIKYDILLNGHDDKISVVLKVYDITGNEVSRLVNEEKPAGSYEIEFNAESLSSGIYLYQLRAGNHVEMKKMILLR
jgi:hypothetical protein